MEKKVSRFRRLREEAKALLDDQLQVSLGGSRLHKFAHFWILVGRSFNRNRCPVRASALAYATLLALVPMLAVVVSVTSSLLKKEGEERIDQFIVKMVASITPPAMLGTNTTQVVRDTVEEAKQAAPPEAQKDGGTGSVAPTTSTNQPVLPAFAQDLQAVQARKAAAREINQFIQNTRSGALGLTGTVLLIFVGISMLSRIEDTFNDIWGVARGRSWVRRVVYYWAVITLAPMLLILALGLATGPHLQGTRTFLTTMPFVGNLVFQLLPVVLLCLTFSVIYMLIPNTKVHWGPALVGGLTAGILFHLNNLGSVLYVSRVVSNSKIYGSMALVPVLMIGLYFSWLILLFGGQVAYAYQNRVTYLEEKQAENVNQRGREFVALRIMTCVGLSFERGETPPSTARMSLELGVPTRLLQQVLRTLASARLVIETAGTESGFVPARPLGTINCHDVLRAMRATYGQELATRDEPTRAEVYGEFTRIEEAERNAATAVSMLALVNRAHAQLQDHHTKALDSPAR
jgi:membrane protein